MASGKEETEMGRKEENKRIKKEELRKKEDRKC